MYERGLLTSSRGDEAAPKSQRVPRVTALSCQTDVVCALISYRNSIGELECEMAEIAVRTTKAIETARQLNKEVKKRET